MRKLGVNLIQGQSSTHWIAGKMHHRNPHKMMVKTCTNHGYLTVCHGKSPFLIGKPSINGPFPMAMLNNQRVQTMVSGQDFWIFPGVSLKILKNQSIH